MQYTLTWLEYLALIGTDLALVGAGVLLFRPWTRFGQSPPVWFVFSVCIGVLALYLMVTRALWVHADPQVATGETLTRPPLSSLARPEAETAVAELAEEPVPRPRTLTVLAWCLLFWTVPVAYYSQKLLRAFETRAQESLTWLDVEIPGSEELWDDENYDQARELARQGDIARALSDGRSFSRNRIRGCLVAARQLENEGRYAESARVYREMARSLRSNTPVWAEVSYRLGKLYEEKLNKENEALALYSEIRARAPENEFGIMAAKAVQTLRPEGDDLLDMLDQGFKYVEERFRDGDVVASEDDPVLRRRPESAAPTPGSDRFADEM